LTQEIKDKIEELESDLISMRWDIEDLENELMIATCTLETLEAKLENLKDSLVG
jgi:chromosome segregation ATPase